jgi:hypothetical protein
LVKNYNKLILKDGKLNNVIIIRYLSQKNSHYSSLCSTSFCCTIDGEYYIVNIIPRTISYLRQQNNPYLELFSSSKIISHKNSNKYKIYNIKNYNAKYIVELVRIHPNNCTCCDMQLENAYIKKMMLMSKQMFFIKLKSNYNVANSLTMFYKENFSMRMFILINGLIRNILILYKNLELRYECMILLQKIMHLENEFNNIYNNNVTEDQKYRHMINTLLQNFEDTFIIPHDDKLPFICIPAPEYINDSTFKLLVWYCIPHNYSIYDINRVITNIYKFIKNKKIDSTVFRNIFLYDDDVKQIYGINDKELQIIKNKYIFNIASLIDNNGNYLVDINSLKKYLNDICKLHKLKYNYIFYHYPTGYDTIAFHLHIFKKYSNIVSNNKIGVLSSIITAGHRHNFSHVYARYITYEFNKFNGDLWKNYHIVLYTIPCIYTFLEFIKKNYLYLFNNNHVINIHEFIIFNNDCINNGIIRNEVPYSLPNKQKLNNYYIELFSYDNNMQTLMSNIKNLLVEYKYLN